MLDLADVPLHTSERGATDPVVLAGGHCTYNPEPLADFLDAAVLGDGEEVVSELHEVVATWLADPPGARDRTALHLALAGVEGVYVPSLYTPRYVEGRLDGYDAAAGAPAVVEKRTVADLADWPYPKAQLVPLTEVVHDRLNVEVFRGCTRGCRFCQAGMITRPVRERPKDQVLQLVRDGIARTGYDEVALTSLSTADFSGIEDVVGALTERGSTTHDVAVSLPSLRVDAFTVATAAAIQQVRRTGLTFAPEGGTWRMRRVINKLISDDDLFSAVEAAFSQGWRRIKLYFLIGLPTERDEDVAAIAELAAECVERGRRHHKAASVTASVGGFVPKANTPFQWHTMDAPEELRRKVSMLRDAARRTRGLEIRWHDPEATAAEGIVSRGDRRIGGGPRARVARRRDLPGVVGALRRSSRWTEALAAEGLDLGVDRAALARPRRDPALGAPVGGSASGLPVGRLRGVHARRGARGLPMDARATTAGPARPTASSTSSRPSRRPRAARRAPARASTSSASPSASPCRPRVADAAHAPRAAAPPLRQARSGPVHLAARPRAHHGARHATARPAARALLGLLAATAAELRPRAPDGLRVAAPSTWTCASTPPRPPRRSPSSGSMRRIAPSSRALAEDLSDPAARGDRRRRRGGARRSGAVAARGSSIV